MKFFEWREWKWLAWAMGVPARVRSWRNVHEQCAALTRKLGRLEDDNHFLLKRCELGSKQIKNLQAGNLPEGPPGLTPAQIERLALLMEDCGEVVKMAAKTLRHGYASASPYGGPMNRILLERKMGHVRAAIEMMEHAGDVRGGDIRYHKRRKVSSVGKWMHHQ